jgi:hypothetical protein
VGSQGSHLGFSPRALKSEFRLEMLAAILVVAVSMGDRPRRRSRRPANETAVPAGFDVGDVLLREIHAVLKRGVGRVPQPTAMEPAQVFNVCFYVAR